MGLSEIALNGMLSLWMDGHFKGYNSVMEIGSQDLQINRADVAQVLRNLTQKQDIKESDISVAKDVYLALGFSNYQCIDSDGRHNALKFDLNENIMEQGFNDQFDLITNFGTTEHCFNQYNAFLNIHNLCAKDGIMIHGLPFQGYLNHGFFNYQPNFYYCLAAANNYRILGMYFNYDGFCGDLTTYSDTVMKFINLTPNSTLLCLVILNKMSSDKFKTPWDAKYLDSCEFDKYNFQKPAKYFLPLPNKELSTRDHVKALVKRIRQVGLIKSILKLLNKG